MSKLVANTPDTGRRLIHSRRVVAEGYLRADGLIEIEARLLDTKAIDYRISTGVRTAGTPIHDMSITLVIDQGMTVRALRAASDAVPYPGACGAVTPAYAELTGLNLFDGFGAAVRERLGGVSGCTHLTELLLSLPTVALQTLASFVADNAESDRKPFQLDKCHALETRGEVVRTHYPKWYVSR